MAWVVDTVHTEVGFAVQHMMIATIRGRFADVDADIHLDEEHPEQSRVVARVQAASIRTSSPDRDEQLRSADFFEVERYPTITFESREVTYTGGSALQIAGDLTIRDVTRPVVLRGEAGGPVEDLWGNQRLGVSLSGEVDREPFGMPWSTRMPTGALSVGMAVQLHVDTQLVRQPDEAA